MTDILGRRIHFDLTPASREIFESIIISRFSVRDGQDEVLRTDDGLVLARRGRTRWRLALASTKVILPSSDPVSTAIVDGVTPERVTVEAIWHTSRAVRRSRTEIRAGGNANVFRGLGALFVPEDLRIPVVEASRANVRHYGLSLIEDGAVFDFDSDEFDIILAKYRYAKNYRHDFLLEAAGGGGFFVETHNFPHLHIPLSPDCGGFVTVGKKLAPGRFDFTAFRIPYGCALHTPANTIHGDGTIVGEYAISVATATAEADTVLFYGENSRAMVPDLFVPA